MAGRHRAPRRTRSLPALPALPSLPPWSSLKAPAAAGATVAAMGAVAALGIGLSGGEDPGRAQLAGFSAAIPSELPSSTTSAKPKKTAATKKTAKKQPKNQAVATIKPKKKAKPVAQSCSTELDGTQPPVAQVGNHVLEKFDVDSVGGQASRGGTSDHPSGLAIDFMVDTETGNALADYMLAHQDEFEVTYVIWQQRYNDGSGWSMMEDRGSPTANHMDHVHVSFSGAPVSITC